MTGVQTCALPILDDAAKYLHHMENHVLMLGKSIAQVIEKIGHNIDMLILDTIHYLPGELLDFLICLPYLSKDAVIILDDLIFAHTGENTNAIATKVLFDLLVGEKVFPSGDGACPKMGEYYSMKIPENTDQTIFPVC